MAITLKWAPVLTALQRMDLSTIVDSGSIHYSGLRDIKLYFEDFCLWGVRKCPRLVFPFLSWPSLSFKWLFFGQNKSASLRIRKRFENLKEGSEIDIGDPSSPRQELLFSCSHKYPVLQGLIMLQVDQGCFFIEHVYYQKNRTFVLFNSLISCFLFCICCCCQSCICLVIMAIISLSFKVFTNTS